MVVVVRERKEDAPGRIRVPIHGLWHCTSRGIPRDAHLHARTQGDSLDPEEAPPGHLCGRHGSSRRPALYTSMCFAHGGAHHGVYPVLYGRDGPDHHLLLQGPVPDQPHAPLQRPHRGSAAQLCCVTDAACPEDQTCDAGVCTGIARRWSTYPTWQVGPVRSYSCSRNSVHRLVDLVSSF